jgi:molybdopterin-synthase adenylyltransferase
VPTAEGDRYSRQNRFAPLGVEGQERIRSAEVVLVGCGALGTVLAELLVRAGVGGLRIIDRDFVEASNLQRQLLFDEEDAREGLPKAVAAVRRLGRVNSDVRLEAANEDLTPANIGDLLEGAQLILDGTDNFETRYLINDYSVREGVPWIYCAAVGSYGIKMPVVPGKSACLRCVYPEPPEGSQPTCETDGVLGPATAAIASLAAGDALKILGRGADAVGRKITTIDVWSGVVRQAQAPARDPECPCCVRREFVHLTGERRAPISLCGRNAVQIHERLRPVNLADLARRLSAISPVRSNEFALRASIEDYELTVFPDGRAIIKGTQDIAVARSVYARYVGS